MNICIVFYVVFIVNMRVFALVAPKYLATQNELYIHKDSTNSVTYVNKTKALGTG